MDNLKNENREFDVLGIKVRVKGQLSESDQGGDAKKIVDLINNEALKIKNMNSQLDDNQVLVLLALQMAADKLTLENEFKESVRKVRFTAMESLSLIEEVSSSTSLSSGSSSGLSPVSPIIS